MHHARGCGRKTMIRKGMELDIRAILMGLVFVLMWSSAFTSARFIVADAAPLHALAIRFFISGAVAVGIARLMGQSFDLTRAQWRATILFGLCQNTLYLGLNFIAMQSVGAGIASIIASTMPLLVALASWALFREKLPALGIAGLFAGFAGVGLIMGSRIGAGADLFGIALCCGGVLALTFATLALRGATSGGNYMMVLGLQMLVGATALLIAARLIEPFRLEPSWPLALSFTYTVFVPGLLATYVWFHLLNRIGPVRAATFHFLSPVFGVSIAAVLLGETLGVLDIVGVGVVTLGILAVQLARAR